MFVRPIIVLMLRETRMARCDFRDIAGVINPLSQKDALYLRSSWVGILMLRRGYVWPEFQRVILTISRKHCNYSRIIVVHVANMS